MKARQTTCHALCKPNVKLPNANYIPSARVGGQVWSIEVRVGSIVVRVESVGVPVGSTKLFGCQPVRGPNMN